MTSPHLPSLLRPTEPLLSKPAGYLGLATYSSLSQFWRYLAAASRAGCEVSLVRGDSEKACRRRIAGHTLEGAALLLDQARLLEALEDGLDPHPALIALLGGDNLPLRELLNAHYTLRLNFVLAFTRSRDLIVRPEFKFVPKVGEKALLPTDLPLATRRLGRDEIRFLLDRACGL
ncbi:hypothetical protein EHF33_07345 [Deinococcus psychrotolerans]|uniref:Uncharacterized protein n=1 Tax=Deinococcus psychrotolerans TaxID=2489213 RepID=A0A3G8YB39_9DEIO|nr:hypothetical protein [Deinococcus psychrotolerans]AZI42582.1 hypothetical protein EHF33_07345 [Deinococcus psychrotolerans]